MLSRTERAAQRESNKASSSSDGALTSKSTGGDDTGNHKSKSTATMAEADKTSNTTASRVRESPRLRINNEKKAVERARAIQTNLTSFFRAVPLKVVASLNPGDRDFAEVRGWASIGKTVLLPTDEEEKIIKDLQVEYDEAIANSLFHTAESIHYDREEVLEAAKRAKNDVELAMKVLTASDAAFRYSLDQKDFVMMGRWSETRKAAELVTRKHTQHLADKKREASAASASRKESRLQCSQANNDANQDEEADQDEVEFVNPFIRAPPAKASRKRKTRKSSASKETVKKKKAPEDKIVTYAAFQSVLLLGWHNQAGFWQKTKNDQRLLLENGKIYCSACNQELVRKCIAQHLRTSTHIGNLEAANKKDAKNQATLYQIKEKANPNSTLSAETVLFRKDYLLHALKSNLTMGMLEGMRPCIEIFSKSGRTLGYCEELMRSYASQLREEERKRQSNLIAQCYPDFGIITDGTPSYCKAEAVVLRLVHKETLKIFEVLVSLKLFDTSLNGANLAGNLFQVLMEDCKLSANHWRVSMMDRAATNKRCMADVNGLVVVNATGKYCDYQILTASTTNFSMIT
jgi:hypothetical protein